MESRELTTNLKNDDTQAPMLLAVSGSVLFLSIILLWARLCSRLRPISNLKADDWTVVGGTVRLLITRSVPQTNIPKILAVVNFFILCTACTHGFGRRTSSVSRNDRLAALRLIFIIQVIWYWSITLVKLSVALLLLRLKPGHYWKLFLRSTIALLLLTVIVQTCFQFLQCRPFAIYWDPSQFFRKGGVKCVPRSVINGNIIANSTIHVSTDLVFSFMPITFISKLHRPRAEKIFLSILMALGLFASTFAILRTVGLATFAIEKDFFRMNVMPVLWASLELEIALLAATLPTLKSFMQSVLVGIGQAVYEEESEMRVRGRLVEMGYLRKGRGRKKSKPDIGGENVVVTFGSPGMGMKIGSPGMGMKMDEVDMVVTEKEIGVKTEVMTKVGKDVGLERVGPGRGRYFGA